MDTDHTSADGGFSPPLSAHLIVRGERLKLDAVGPNGIRLESPRRTPPCRAEIHFNLDGHVTIHPIDLPEGIEPSRPVQPFVMLPTGEEAVA